MPPDFCTSHQNDYSGSHEKLAIVPTLSEGMHMLIEQGLHRGALSREGGLWFSEDTMIFKEAGQSAFLNWSPVTAILRHRANDWGAIFWSLNLRILLAAGKNQPFLSPSKASMAALCKGVGSCSQTTKWHSHESSQRAEPAIMPPSLCVTVYRQLCVEPVLGLPTVWTMCGYIPRHLAWSRHFINHFE